MNYERNWKYILSLLEAVYSRDPLSAYEKASDDEKDCWAVFAPLLEHEKIFVQDVYLSEEAFDIEDLADAHLTMKGYDLLEFLRSHPWWRGSYSAIWVEMERSSRMRPYDGMNDR